jgi:hypothetical protein
MPGRTAVRPGGPEATDCAARGGSTGLHSGLRTSRTAGLLCRPRAGRHVYGCHVAGADPGRRRHGVIAAVGRARRGPAGPPRSGVRAGARTATRVKFATRAVCRGSRAGRRTGPARVSGEPAYPRARAASRVYQAAGGVLTGPRPASPEPGPRAASVMPQVGHRRARGQHHSQHPGARAGPGRLGLRHRRSRGPGAAVGRSRRRGRPGWARADSPTCRFVTKSGCASGQSIRQRAACGHLGHVAQRCKHAQTNSNMPVDL